MIRLKNMFGAAALLALLPGCLIVSGGDDDDSTPTPTATDTPGPPLAGAVYSDVYITGAFNNRVVVDGDTAYVVASGDNRVEMVDLTTCTSRSDSCEQTATAVFPQFSNPWNVAIDAANDTLYSSLLFGGAGDGSVQPASATDGTLGTEITGGGADFDAPQGMAIANGKLYVGNTAISCDMNGCTWGDAFVTVIDLTTETVSGTIGPLPFKNPFGVQVFGGKVWVVCTGEFDASYQPASDGGLVVIDPDTDTIDGQVTIGVAAPGPSMAIVGNTAYLPTSRGPEVFKVNLDTKTVIRGPQNPIVVTDDDTTFTSWAEAGPDGMIYVASFNQDRVWILDPVDDTLVDVNPATTPVDAFVVGPGGDTPTGPLALGSWTDAAGADHILVLQTLSNSMSDITLTGN